MRRIWSAQLTLIAVAAIAGTAVMSPAVATPQRAVSTAGCALGRPAIAHYAGGVVASSLQKLIPCATDTGYYTGETTIGVTAAGTVWLSAANWESALARSTDQGAHWQSFTVPGPQAYPGCGIGVIAPAPCNASEQSKYDTAADAFLWVDPRTSKIFWSKTYGYGMCSSLGMSPDNGATWQPVPQFACPGGDYEKVAGGPPPAGGPAPAGYPDVLYVCVNGPAPVFAVGPGRVCYKSLDGGGSWNLAGMPVPSPLAPGCLQFQEPEAVGPDGTLYVPLNCGAAGSNPAGMVRVAVSHDEGGTWSYAQVPTGSAGSAAGFIGGVSLAVDRAGTVYVVWPGRDHRPYLAISTNEGATWSGPLMVGAPGVAQGGPPFAQVAALQPGHIAIAYYGYAGGDSSVLSGYLTESFDARDAKPLFYSAELNDPAHPLYFPVKSGNLPRNDYLGVTIAPDGTPWTGLVKLVSNTPDSQGFIQSTGFVGRLVPASTLAGS
jgi:hypothetical protein